MGCNQSNLALDKAKPAASDLIAAGAKTVGATVAIGCGPMGTTGNYVKCPDGFQNVGETGSCTYCAGHEGTAGSPAGIIGHRINCKLVQYLGNKDDCCRTTSSGGGSCDPSWLNLGSGQCDDSLKSWCQDNMSSSQCQNFLSQRNGTAGVNDLMTAYCSVGDRIFTDKNCVGWAGSTAGSANNTTTANTIKQSYCSSKLQDTNCLDYCTSSTGANTPQKNWCDSQWKKYAAAHPEDPMCACLLPLTAANYPNYTKYLALNQKTGSDPDPRCFDSSCIQSGYKQGSAANCPSCVQNQEVTIQNADNAKIADVLQSCSVGTDPPQTSTPTGASAANATTTKATSSVATAVSTVKQNPLMVVLCVLICLLCAGTSALMLFV